MRKCDKCGNLMCYNESEKCWICNMCGEIIQKVTIHGDKMLFDDEGRMRDEFIWI